MEGTIFISYRRDDEAFFAEQLYERLKQKFSKERVFFDVDNIPAGRNFVKVLHEQVQKADVMIVVIGKEWMDAQDSSRKRRLDNPRDFVRIEIESALAQDKMIVPVLVGNARMPTIEALPNSLRPMVEFQAFQF